MNRPAVRSESADFAGVAKNGKSDPKMCLVGKNTRQNVPGRNTAYAFLGYF